MENIKFLNNKCKDLLPFQTIENITNFFKLKNLNIKIENLKKSIESSTWSCQIKLFSEDVLILQTCGKGTTKDFALASGYAELYERFCNKIIFNSNPIISNLLIQNNFKKNGYYIHKEEKIINFNDFKEKNSLLYNIYLNFLGNEKNLEEFLNLFIDGKIIEIPYKNCFSNDIFYTDPRLQKKVFTSSGMAAGNTLEEALIQGISEYFEHYVQELFLKTPPKILYEIPLELINLENKKIINNIKSYNKEIKIFDLSYNYNLPVCLVVLYNNNSYNYIINFGSAPLISIAIERTLTELYQNIESYNNSLNQFSQHPSRLYPWEEQMEKLYINTSKSNTFFEINLADIKKIKKINSVYYQENKKYTNKDFLKLYEKICNNNNIELFYINNSKDENIYSIQIISSNLNHRKFFTELFINLSNQEKNKCLNLLIKFYIFIYENLLYKQSSIKIETLDEINKLTILEKKFFDYLAGANWFIPFNKSLCLNGIYNLFSKNFNIEYLAIKFKNSPFEFYIRKYLSLYQYKKSNQYSNKEIYKIFYPLDNSLTEKDIEFCDDKNFLIQKIIIEPMYTMYNSSAFVNMIEAYCD